MTDARAITTAFLNAYYHGDHDTARSVLADDVSFEGPAATFTGADKFLRASAHVAPSVKSIDVRKVFVDGDDVCVFYDVHLDHAVQRFSAAQWFTLHGGKIASIRMIFDTAPLRDGQGQSASEDTALDPVCGMRVTKSTAAAVRTRGEETYYFCAVGCASAFDKGT